MPVPQSFDYTPDEIRAWGDRASSDAGEKAADRGFVAQAAWDPATRTASGVVTVNGSAVKTSFTVKPGRTIVENHCPCPASQKRGLVCFHMLAVAWTLQRRAAAARSSAGGVAAEADHARRVAEALARGESVERDLVRGVPVSLRLAVPRDWPARYAAGVVPLSIALARDDAPEERPRPISEYVVSRTPVRLSEEDDSILFVLEDIAEGSLLAPVRLAPPYFVWLLDMLGKLGRPLLCRSGAMRVLGAEDAVPSHLLASFDHETGEILLALNTEIPGAPEGTLPAHVVFGPHGYAFHDGVFRPLKAVLPVLYQKVYAETIAIPRIGTRRFLEHELPALRRSFDVRCEFDPELFSWTPAKPSFRLVASATNGQWPLDPDKIGVHVALRLSLNAVYAPPAGGDPVEVEAAGPAADISVPAPDDPYGYFVRNPEAERSALGSLTQYGIAGADGARDAASMRGSQLAPLAGAENLYAFLATTVPALESREGWSVTLEGPLGALSQRYDRVAIVVHAADSLGLPGHFDFGFSYESAARSTAIPARDVIAAKNNGQCWVVGRKNRPVLFDPNAIDALVQVEKECGVLDIGEVSALHRVAAVHAPFVLAAVDRLARSNVVFDKASEAWVARTRKALSHDADAEDRAVVPEPLRSTLRPYQRAGVAWLRWLERNRLGGILADEMGLGKTIQALAWLSLPRFNEADRGRPALVVCPTSLVENWAHEARQFTPDLKVLVYAGADRAALRPLAEKEDLVVTSYAILRRDVQWLSAVPFSAVVLDEAQNIKNQRTQSAQAAKLLQAGSRLVLTGTPIENSLADLWSIMDFLDRGYLGDYDVFRAEYEAPVSLLGDPAARPADRREAARALDRLRDKIRPFLLRRLKADVARDLPAKIVQNSWPELTGDQRRVYDKVYETLRGQIRDAISRDGFEKSRMVVLTALLRLRQVCCDLRLLGDANPLPDSAEPSGKTEQLLELLDQARDGGHRTLVFSQFVEMLKLLRAELDARGVPYCYLDGASTDRLESVHRFNSDPSIPVFLISLKAGGTGLNLVGADEVVLFDPWWNPSIEDQAIDRAHRIGQKRTVHAFKLITPGTIEEKVLAMQQRKRAVIAATIAASDQSIAASLTADDVRQLFDL